LRRRNFRQYLSWQAKVCSCVATALAVFEPDKHEVLIVAVEANDLTYAFVWDRLLSPKKGQRL
jgi:hypothetical protein